MENNKNIEKENAVVPQDVEPTNSETKNEKQSNLVIGGTLEMICMALMGCGMLASLFVGLMWIKVTIAVAMFVIFALPVVARVMRMRNSMNTEKILSILKKKGFAPILKGDEIRWVANGKESILRIHSRCQVEISREYDIPSVALVIDGNEKAALETMKEVYLAKVSVMKFGESSLLAFSTESLCTSSKEFMTYLPMCLDILDLAETRQRFHIKEIHESGQEKERRRIGFEYPDGEIR